MGMAIAKEMREAGEDAFFLVNENLAPLLASGRVRGETLQESIGPLLEVLIQDIIDQEKPSSIVLADHLVCSDAFQRMGLSLDFLGRFGLPVIAIDTWNHSETGMTIDLAGRNRWILPPWSPAVTHSIVPVPFNKSNTKNACSFMPKVAEIPRRIREHVRRDLGLYGEDRLAILCTSEWQSNPQGDRLTKRAVTSVLRLLAEYFQLLGSRFHLLHFAPRRFDELELIGNRYHWLPTFPPMIAEQFQSVIGSGDMVLSLNYSATTNNLAMALGVPVVLVKNSCEAASADDVVAWLGSPLSKSLRQWVRTALPISRFRMWPLGFYSFLTPTFSGNDLQDVYVETELLREEDFISTCEDAISSKSWREGFAHRRKRYLANLAELPLPGALTCSLVP